jgi:hypothetical protein
MKLRGVDDDAGMDGVGRQARVTVFFRMVMMMMSLQWSMVCERLEWVEMGWFEGVIAWG